MSNNQWEHDIVPTVFPMVLQAIMLYLLYVIVTEERNSDDEQPRAVFVVTALIVFFIDIFTYLLGPSLQCLYAACTIEYHNRLVPESSGE